MTIPEVDTTLLRAVLRKERRRAAIKSLENAAFIDVHTVERLRCDVFVDGGLARGEAEALFALERRDVSSLPEWRDFFVGAIVDHVLDGGRTMRGLEDRDAEWLLGQADRTCSVTAFAILMSVLGEARAAPAWFSRAVQDRAERGWPGLTEAVAA